MGFKEVWSIFSHKKPQKYVNNMWYLPVLLKGILFIAVKKKNITHRKLAADQASIVAEVPGMFLIPLHAKAYNFINSVTYLQGLKKLYVVLS